jgi:hypothetical protein
MSPRHEEYLRRKATGYYQSNCGCGRKKSLQAQRCLHCSGFAPKPSYCGCGERKHRFANRCHGCANPPHVLDPNPHCPNGGRGGAECEARYPHHHCVCLEPIEPERTRCDTCLREAARIANKRLSRVA